ncbi:isoprenylcysteine carboxylmethyltransferase family protein [bacterium]|nr:isoprenylcysteine carboxylmethyltransferase family protein [bacterium]
MDTMIPVAEMRRKILPKVLIRFFFGFIFLGLLIFVPAGTMKFFNGWLLIAGLFIPMMFIMCYLFIKDPELLEKRINLKEKEDAQKKYVKLSLVLFVSAYIIPGLDFRYNWSDIPLWIVFIALFVMICGYIMFIIVMLQNRYASRVIEIQDRQKLIDTGLYSVVRHPMYLSATILYLASSVVMGSYYALIPMVLVPFLLAFRIKNEEKILLTGLPGYEEYVKKVKYRMIPFIW